MIPLPARIPGNRQPVTGQATGASLLDGIGAVLHKGSAIDLERGHGFPLSAGPPAVHNYGTSTTEVPIPRETGPETPNRGPICLPRCYHAPRSGRGPWAILRERRQAFRTGTSFRGPRRALYLWASWACQGALAYVHPRRNPSPAAPQLTAHGVNPGEPITVQKVGYFENSPALS